MLNIVLCAQRSFGSAVFRMLKEKQGVQIASVFTPEGDGLATLAGMYHIPVLPAGTLRADRLPDGIDLIVAAHSHDFISRAVRNRLSIGAIGYHPSLLPLHRGRDAVRWTIRMGDRIAGGTVFWLSDTVDGGPVAAQDWCFVRPEDTAQSLWRRELFPMGVRLLSRAVDEIRQGRLVMRDQDHSLASPPGNRRSTARPVSTVPNCRRSAQRRTAGPSSSNPHNQNSTKPRSVQPAGAFLRHSRARKHNDPHSATITTQPPDRTTENTLLRGPDRRRVFVAVCGCCRLRMGSCGLYQKIQIGKFWQINSLI